MAKRKARTRIISVRLYPGQDDALIAWHDSLAHLPFGAKSQGIKAALLRGIGGDTVGASSPSVDVGALLSDIRKVVEAAAMQAFAGSGATHTAGPRSGDEAEVRVADAMLDELADNLLM